MHAADFKLLKNFRRDEKDAYGRNAFENFQDINGWMMEMVDVAVSFAKTLYNTIFIVHDINQGNHSAGSYHYHGKAIDGHLKDVPLFEQCMIFVKVGFKGMGFYPEWNTPGIHVDIREQEYISFWYQEKGIYVYDFAKVMEKLKEVGNKR